MSTDDTDDNTTESARTRWDYTNDVVTIAVVATVLLTWLGYIAAIATGRVPPPEVTVPPAVGYAAATFVVMMAVWLYGRETFEAVRGLFSPNK